MTGLWDGPGRRLLAVVVLALALAAPAHAYYNDGGSGGNRPDCTNDNIGDSFGPWQCDRDPFYGDVQWWWAG